MPDPRDPTPVRAVQRNGRWVVVDADGRRLPDQEPLEDGPAARAVARRVNQTWRSAKKERSSKGGPEITEGLLGRFNPLEHPRAPKLRKGGGQFTNKGGVGQPEISRKGKFTGKLAPGGKRAGPPTQRIQLDKGHGPERVSVVRITDDIVRVTTLDREPGQMHTTNMSREQYEKYKAAAKPEPGAKVVAALHGTHKSDPAAESARAARNKANDDRQIAFHQKALAGERDPKEIAHHKARIDELKGRQNKPTGGGAGKGKVASEDRPLGEMTDDELKSHWKEMATKNSQTSSPETAKKTCKRVADTTTELKKRGWHGNGVQGWKKAKLDEALAELNEVLWSAALHPRAPKGRRGGGRFAEKLFHMPDLGFSDPAFEGNLAVRRVQHGVGMRSDYESLWGKPATPGMRRLGRANKPVEFLFNPTMEVDFDPLYSSKGFGGELPEGASSDPRRVGVGQLESGQQFRWTGQPGAIYTVAGKDERGRVRVHREGLSGRANPEVWITRDPNGEGWGFETPDGGGYGAPDVETAEMLADQMGYEAKVEGRDDVGRANPSIDDDEYDLSKYRHPNVLPREPVPLDEPGEFSKSPLAGVPESGLDNKPLGPMRPEMLRRSLDHAIRSMEWLEAKAAEADAKGNSADAAEYRRLAERWKKQADELRYAEPIGSGADPYGRPDPQTSPEYWTE